MEIHTSVPSQYTCSARSAIEARWAVGKGREIVLGGQLGFNWGKGDWTVLMVDEGNTVLGWETYREQGKDGSVGEDIFGGIK